MQILILNGSLGGSGGNTARAIGILQKHLSTSDVVHLAQSPAPSREDLGRYDAFVFASGVYWDSWGSPLQTFFETATSLEGDGCWFGKPAACLVTMHSVGGKEVLSRMQGVLNTFGLFVPPMTAMTYSLANHLALETAGSHADDLWSLGDLEVLAHNLTASAGAAKPNYQPWSVDRANPKRIWLKSVST